MQKQIVWSAALSIVLATSAAQAQEKRSELGFNLGYTGSEGVNATDIVDGARFDAEIKNKSSFSWNFDYGYFVNEKVEIGALFAQQNSELQFFAQNGAFITVPENWNVNNIQATVAYNTGTSQSKARFYLLGGLGVTRYTSKDLTLGNGDVFETDGATKFATTWGTGVKFYPAPGFGMKMGVRWTPTALGSLTDNWLCGPFDNCEVVDKDRTWARQLEVAVGALVRF